MGFLRENLILRTAAKRPCFSYIIHSHVLVSRQQTVSLLILKGNSIRHLLFQLGVCSLVFFWNDIRIQYPLLFLKFPSTYPMLTVQKFATKRVSIEPTSKYGEREREKEFSDIDASVVMCCLTLTERFLMFIDFGRLTLVCSLTWPSLIHI